MKKFLAALVVLAIAGLSSIAFAADVTLGGSVDIRSRNLDNTADFDDAKNDKSVITQTRFRLDAAVKGGDVKGKIALESDWDNFGSGGFEGYKGQTFAASTSSATSTVPNGSNKRTSQIGIREAWLLTPVPGTPLYLKGGHMFLQLGQGWFFRSQKSGSDAWVLYTDIDKLHLGLVDVKVSEGVASADDDVDAYVLVATNKFGDATAGIDITDLMTRRNAAGKDTQLYNVGLNFAGKLGPVALKAEVDKQFGAEKTATSDKKYQGLEVVVQGSVPMDPVTVNFTAAYGTGPKANENNIHGFQNFLDGDPHYTLLWEYIVPNAACGGVNKGFCNTTAISAGAMFAATKNLSVGLDAWLLQATEDVTTPVTTDAATAKSNDVGTEIDVKINWKMADNVTWNWTLATLMAGDALGKDDAIGAQGVLSMKF
jgi:hypothetical protein